VSGYIIVLVQQHKCSHLSVQYEVFSYNQLYLDWIKTDLQALFDM